MTPGGALWGEHEEESGNPGFFSEIRKQRLAVIVLVIASLIPLSAAVRFDARFPSDDALISLTYAKNLARGDGFVFNQPPPVPATTTPAFTMVVAAVTAISGIEPTVVALWFSALCWLAVIWSFFVFREAFGLDPGQAAMIGWMVAAQGWVEHLSMEAYPFALILVVAAAMVWSRRSFIAGLAIGVLFLTRGEGILFGAILGVVVLVDEIRHRTNSGRSPTMMYVLGAALPVLAWSAYALPTFGSILPATLGAKMAQVASGLWAPFPVRLFGEWLPGWGLGPWGFFSTVLGFVLVGVGLIIIGARQQRMVIFPIWLIGYAAGYSLLGVPGYHWYRLPIFFVLALCAGLGLEAALRWGIGPTPGTRTRSAATWTLGVILMVAAGWQTLGAIEEPPTDQRGPKYLKVAQWLNTHASAGQSVAFFEVGTLGYYTNLRIIDQVGLVTPSMVPHVLDQDFATGFWEESPDYLIGLEGSEFTRMIVDNPIFPAAYSKAKTFDGPDHRRLTVYRSRP